MGYDALCGYIFRQKIVKATQIIGIQYFRSINSIINILPADEFKPNFDKILSIINQILADQLDIKNNLQFYRIIPNCRILTLFLQFCFKKPLILTVITGFGENYRSTLLILADRTPCGPSSSNLVEQSPIACIEQFSVVPSAFIKTLS